MKQIKKACEFIKIKKKKKIRGSNPYPPTIKKKCKFSDEEKKQSRTIPKRKEYSKGTSTPTKAIHQSFTI